MALMKRVRKSAVTTTWVVRPLSARETAMAGVAVASRKSSVTWELMNSVAIRRACSCVVTLELLDASAAKSVIA